MLLVLGALSCAAPSPDRRPAASSDPDAWLDRAMALFRVGRDGAAAEQAETLLHACPDFARGETVRFLAGEARYRLGEFERAWDHYRRLLEDFPCTRAHRVLPDRLFVIGTALVLQPKPLLLGWLEDRRAGVEALGRLVVHYPEYRRADQAWLRLGEAHFRDGAHALAVEAYQRLLRRCPTSPLREEAQFRIASVLRVRAKGAGYDPESLLQAWCAARRCREDWPTGRYAGAAAALMRDVELLVGRSQAEIAEFYAARAVPAGERFHTAQAAAELPAPRASRPPWQTDDLLLPVSPPAPEPSPR